MTDINHQPCPYEDCGSSDAFSWNTAGYGKCHACCEAYPSKRKAKVFDWVKEVYKLTEKEAPFPTNLPKVAKVPQKEVTTSGKYMNWRGITARTMEDYKVLTYSDRQEYVYPSGGIKVRRLDEKEFYAKNNFKGDELFGMNLFTPASSKRVTVTEGELDALSVAQMLKSNYTNPVVSLPSATPSKKMWEKCRKWLDSFEMIVLSVDNDDAGDKLAERMTKMFPNKIYRVNHGEFKDANDFLRANKVQEFKSAWFNAKKYIPDNVLNTTQDFLDLYNNTPEHMYVETGIEDLDAKLLGLMQGHFTVFKAPTGIGKTELMRKLEYKMIESKVPFASWHLEETKLRSILGLASYDLCENVTRRDLIVEKGLHKEVEGAITRITEDELLYQFFLNEDQGPDQLIEEIRFLTQACGVRYVFFEPIQDVVSGRTDENKEAILADLAVRLSKLAAELNIGIVTIAHTNEDGAVKYCKMIEQRASVIVRLDRDKDAEDMETRNTTTLYIEKNRPSSEEGYGGKLFFDVETFTLKEIF